MARRGPTSHETGRAGSLDGAIGLATESLLAVQHADGHWLFELEADATIPAEYILLQHYLDGSRTRASGGASRVFARRQKATDGGWPLFLRGRARSQLLGQGLFRAEGGRRSRRRAAYGAGARGDPGARRGRRCNVFTRVLLALFGEVPWRAVPVMPVEIMLLPQWSPFHLAKVSYWSRTVSGPAFGADGACARAPIIPHRVTIRELFVEPSGSRARLDRRATRSPLAVAFGLLDGCCAWRSRCFRPVAAARDRQGGRVRQREAQWRGRSRRDFPGHGELVDDVRLPRLCAQPPCLSTVENPRSASCSSSTPSAAIASPACRRSGTRRWPATR